MSLYFVCTCKFIDFDLNEINDKTIIHPSPPQKKNMSFTHYFCTYKLMNEEALVKHEKTPSANKFRSNMNKKFSRLETPRTVLSHIFTSLFRFTSRQIDSF